jgi:hypothetical protein
MLEAGFTGLESYSGVLEDRFWVGDKPVDAVDKGRP